MKADIERVLIPQEKIAARVRELAAQIVIDHTPPRMPGEADLIEPAGLDAADEGAPLIGSEEQFGTVRVLAVPHRDHPGQVGGDFNALPTVS